MMKIAKLLSVIVILSFGFGLVFNLESGIENNETEETASARTVELTDANFKKSISKGIVLVDFWAPWCGPCRTQGPIVDEIASEFRGKVVVGKVNVDNNKGISGEYHIRSIPTLIIFKNGKVMERMTGLRSQDYLEKQLNVYL